MTRCQSSRAVPPADAAAPLMPALFAAYSTAIADSADLAVSGLMTVATPRALAISSATRYAASRSISVSTMPAPLVANGLPMASPSPDQPPVTIATLPANALMQGA